MKLYVLFEDEGFCEGESFRGVFTTIKKAEKAKKLINYQSCSPFNKDTFDSIRIEEIETDKLHPKMAGEIKDPKFNRRF